jgi:hypothetical protein
VKTLRKSYEKQVQKYRFDKDEMIVSVSAGCLT